MAGSKPSLFYRFTATGTEHDVDSWYGTQDAADDAAGAGFTANQGAVEVPDNWAPGWIRHPVSGAWRERGYDDLSELDQRKAAAVNLFDVLDDQEQELGLRMGVPAKVRGRVVDILSYARWACYAVFTGTTWTAAQQIAWATAMLTGPSDAGSMDLLIQKASAMAAGEVPTTTSSWVSPTDASRSTLAGSKAASALWNAAIGDLTTFNPGNRAWIDRAS